MKNRLILWAFVCQCTLLFAQPKQARFFSLQDGLSNQQVLDIVHDDEGFTWVATELGLNRFAGKSFKSYYASESQDGLSLNSNEINTLLFDDRKLYIGTRSNGLNVLDLNSNTFSYYLHDPKNPKSIATNDITDLIKSKDGTLWLATYHQGVQHFDPQKKVFTPINKKNLPQLPENSIWSLAEDKRRTLYIGHVNAGLTILDPVRRSVRQLTSLNTNYRLPDNEVKALFCDRYDNIWIGTRKGLAVYHPLTGRLQFIPLARLTKGKTEPFVYSIKEIDDKLWIGAESSQLFILQPDYGYDSQVAGFRQQHTVDLGKGNNAMVQHIAPDRFGNIWLALYGGGLGVISHLKPFFDFFPAEGVLSERLATVSGIYENENRTMSLTTEGSGIVNTDQKGRLLRQLNSKSGAPDDFILSAFKDQKQQIWLGLKKGGVAVKYKGSDRWQDISLGEQVTDVRTIYEDHQGSIWIAAQQGLFIYNPLDRTVQKLLINQPMLGDYAPRAIVEDEKHNIWVGTYGQGLYVYDQHRKLIRKMNRGNGLRNNTINHLLRDRNNTIWIATNAGVAMQRAQQKIGDLILLTPPGEGAWLFTNALAEDQYGNIWCSTKSGMLRYVPQEKRFLQYDEHFGLPLGGFINGSVGKDSHGRLFFGMQEGVCSFEPGNLPLSLPVSPVRIGRFTVFQSGESNRQLDKYPDPTQEVELRHDENSFRVELAVMDYALNGLVEFGYQLQGFNNDWIFLGTETNLDFRNIPYGDHDLLIRKRMKNGQWSPTLLRLKINIAAPFYLTLPAKIAYALILLLFIYTLVFFYIKRMHAEAELKFKDRKHKQEEELYNERMSFYTHITHELRTPLTLILGPLDDLVHEEQLNAKHRGLVQTVQQSASRLFNLVNQLLEFRKVESQFKPLVLEAGSLAEMLTDLVYKYKTLNSKPQLTLLADLPEADVRTLFDPEIVQLIVDNLLSNAYKYTAAGSIKLHLHYEGSDINHWAVLSVTDTGCGIPAPEIDRIFEKFYQIPKTGIHGTGIGLALVKELVAIHQGQIEVQSKLGLGTVFTVRFRMSKVSPKEVESTLARPRSLILFVEDNPELRAYLGDSLSQQYDVLLAENGAIAFELASARMPDLIISDIMMPELDGFQLVEKLKQTDCTNSIPLLLLTAKDTDMDRQRGYDLGIDSYLVKPVSTQLLHKRIQNLLGRAKLVQYNPEYHREQKDTQDAWFRENEFVRDFMSIVEQHMQDELLDAAALAEKMNMSQSTLYRKLKGITGKNINQLVRKIRIHKAADLLKTGKYNVTEVSFLVGINSVIYFRQCFKEEFGQLPSTFQKSDLKLQVQGN
ncbi:hybrid sensor histidine kinase/response regulator transcription factor [Sphingobacterium detergens]|uniref:histidine kinase n=1 Tax=Sphingobacterium detergens TaxID=1145106 RepID=A0A420BGM3_SPHD1|nr:hybrid sensor histidine kinase/response regulator transcription factor [Sphingobacterium detergens]RKE55862.1 signal transduction histidine kinase [Sphingobacterium detergens]